jgi:hypothetical protein
MKKAFVGILSALSLVAVAPRAHAQIPLSIDVRGGAALPQGDLGDDAALAADMGWGFEGSVGLALTPMFSLYGGGSRYVYERGGDDTATDGEFVDQGFHAGAKVSLAPMLMGASPWVRGGVIFHDLEQDDAGATEEDTSTEAGFEVGAGLEIPLGQVLSFTPGARYHSYRQNSDSLGDELNISAWSIEFGGTLRF